MSDLYHARLNYDKARLDEQDVNASPVQQFHDWFEMAKQTEQKEVYSLSLATASALGQPSVRTVLLRSYDDSGFVFFTNYDSAKGKNLAENPQAEMLFYWASQEQQVRIYGKVEKISREASDAYFLHRPRDSQIASHVSNPQSSVIANRAYLDDTFAKLQQQWHDEDIPLPENWGGYSLIPESFEFWQGGVNRLHDRLVYQKNEQNQWEISRLAP